jgi:hypothetical protein
MERPQKSDERIDAGIKGREPVTSGQPEMTKMGSSATSVRQLQWFLNRFPKSAEL